MPRVLLDFRLQHAGVGRCGRSLIRGLEEIGSEWRPIVVTPGAGAIERFSRAAFTPWGRIAIGRAASRSGAALVHGLHLETPRTSVPTMVTIPDLIPLRFPESMPNPLRRAAYRSIVRSSIDRASKIVTYSQASAADLVRFGADFEKLVVIPPGVDPAFRPPTQADRLEARRRFAGGRRYVASTARGKPHKNLAALSLAAERMREIDVAFVCSGWPEKLAPHLEFAGHLDDHDLCFFFGGAEAFAFPSLAEGFGLPAVEALACGTPVVCGEGVGALPHIREGVIEVDVMSPEEIADALRSVSTDEDLRGKLSSRGLEAVKHLSIEAAARAHADLYSQVISGS